MYDVVSLHQGFETSNQETAAPSCVEVRHKAYLEHPRLGLSTGIYIGGRFYRLRRCCIACHSGRFRRRGPCLDHLKQSFVRAAPRAASTTHASASSSGLLPIPTISFGTHVAGGCFGTVVDLYHTHKNDALAAVLSGAIADLDR